MIPYFSQPAVPLGPLTIYGFGVLVAVAIFLGMGLVRRRARRHGLDPALAYRLVTWILVGGFLGAHLVDRFVYFPRETLREPITILKLWVGLSSFGGFLGAVAGAVIFIRREKLVVQAWEYLDTIAYAFPFAWIVGRLGCFVAFDHPGARTSFFLGQQFKDGVVRHNLGLEEAIYTVFMSAVFYVLGRKPRPVGFFVGLLPLLYAPVRFGLDFLRIVDVRYLGLTPGQYGSIGVGLLGALILWTRRHVPPIEVAAKEDAAPAAAVSRSAARQRRQGR
jgi:phosphatidylglycerol---prolipoprotein diacylglyceryl transferase